MNINPNSLTYLAVKCGLGSDEGLYVLTIGLTEAEMVRYYVYVCVFVGNRNTNFELNEV